MGKIIESPVKRFSGTVVLPDYLTFPQYDAFNECWEKAKVEGQSQRDRNHAVIPGILAVVTEWHLESIPEKPTVETFPASPIASANRLLAWLFTEITETLIFEVDKSPNA